MAGRAPAPTFELEWLEPRQFLSAALPPASAAGIIDSAVAHWRSQLGQPVYYNGYDWPDFWGMVCYANSGMSLNLSVSSLGGGYRAPATNSSYSTTLTQVQGVDEADLVKTDGQRFYIVGGGKLVITRAYPATNMAVLSETEVTGDPLALYLDTARRRVTVLSQRDPSAETAASSAADGGAPQAQQAQVVVTVLDVADPARPRLVERTRVDGELVDSRLVDDRLYLVVRNNLLLPGPQFNPALDAAKEPTGEYTYRVLQGSYEGEAAYRARLAAYLSSWQGPEFDSAANDGQSAGALLDGNLLLLSAHPEGTDLATVVGLNVGDNRGGLFGAATVTGVDALEVYASADHLYLASGPQNTWLNWFPGDSQTDLYQFDLRPGALALAAHGTVIGGVYGQWAMDEYAGYFRVVTERGAKGDASSTTQLFVLQQTGNELKTVGQISDLAPGETIESVRFLGDRAYVVTCLRCDPLFPIDLSDPANPKVLGELKVPGYSFFLQPIDATHLLGIGRQVRGSTGTGMQVSLFDVSDVANPQQVGVLTYDYTDYGVASEAEYDHHALGWYPEAGILAVPMLHGGSFSYGLDYRNATLEVVRVTADGLTSLGAIEHDTSIRRSVRIGDVLYSISDTQIKANVLTRPDEQVGELDFNVPLPPPPPPPTSVRTGTGTGAGTGGWVNVGTRVPALIGSVVLVGTILPGAIPLPVAPLALPPVGTIMQAALARSDGSGASANHASPDAPPSAVALAKPLPMNLHTADDTALGHGVQSPAWAQSAPAQPQRSFLRAMGWLDDQNDAAMVDLLQG